MSSYTVLLPSMTCNSTFSTNAGSHPHLIVEVHVQEIPTTCVAYLDIGLPSESFVDIYELSECMDSFNVSNRDVTHLEGPTIADSRMQTISIELRDLHLGQRIEIPLHMRYPLPQHLDLPRDQSIQNVLYKPPSLSWICEDFGKWSGSFFAVYQVFNAVWYDGETVEPLSGSVMCPGNGPNNLLLISLPLPPAGSPKLVEMITSLAEMSTFIIAICFLWMTYPFRQKYPRAK